MGMFDLKLFDSRNPDLKRIEFLGSEIKRLIEERDRINLLLESLGRDLNLSEVNFLEYMPIKIHEISVHLEEDWEKHKFESENVKKVIATIRSLLFNDDDPKFQDLLCENLYFCDGQNETTLFFHFVSSSNPEKKFHIGIPYIDGKFNPFSPKSLSVPSRYMVVGKSSGKSPFSVSSKVYSRSFRWNEIKKMIDRIVLNDEEPKELLPFNSRSSNIKDLFDESL